MNSIHLKSINDLCEVGLTHEIKHPLVAVIEFDKISHAALPYGMQGTIDCYCIMFKKHCPNVLRYGMQEIDFHEGSLLCMAPNQVIEIGNETEIKNGIEGWCLLFHPDLIRDTSLGSNIKCYSFFSYDTSEALHLSDKEQKTLYECIANIQRELNDNIDQYTQNLIVSNIELLLNYCLRYYGRQFITRKGMNRCVLAKVEKALTDYFSSGDIIKKGLPTVKYLGDIVNLSPNYLSDLLKKETGKSAQDHIHFYLLEEAKKSLLNSDYSVS